MVKALLFKGDKKPKKRKRAAPDSAFSTALSHPDAPTDAEPPKGAPVADAEADDSWVSADSPSDISGPILIVLPTAPPSALSTDAHGAVFALTLENVLDDAGASAEPHDVRQVWIANRVAGTESFSLKGHHGKYLGAGKSGTLSAAREAVGEEEAWNIIPVPAEQGGGFALATARDVFLRAEEKAGGGVLVRADGEGIEFRSTLRVRMQARFKPRLKVAREERARERISRKELEDMAGRRLEEGDVKRLKRARREGNFHEALLDVKVKGKHDKFA